MSAGAVFVAGAISRDTVGLGIGNSSNIKGVKITFKSSKKINKEKNIFLIIFFIFFLNF